MTRQVVAVPEQAVRLRVNGLVVAVWSCTPAALEELATGRLVAEGFIRSAADLLMLRTLPEQAGVLRVDAEVEPVHTAAALEEREHRTQHGCGPRFLLDCRPDLVPARPRSPLPPVDAFPDLFRALYDRAAAHRETGGHHAAASSDGTGIVTLFEEVARHNAVDKVVGAAVLEERPLHEIGLITTARISGGMAAKCARAGLGWIASRSVPTTLAVELAAAAGMPILARAAGREATVFGAA